MNSLMLIGLVAAAFVFRRLIFATLRRVCLVGGVAVIVVLCVSGEAERFIDQLG